MANDVAPPSSDDAVGRAGPVLKEVVSPALADQRVDRVVAMMTGLSRRSVAEMIESGLVEVDGRPVPKPSIRLELGSVIGVRDLPEPDRLEPDFSVELSIVYEDDQVVVVDKAAGVVVHPGAGTRDGTLVAGLLARYPELEELGREVDQADRPGIVHRLDRGTSGLLMVARTAHAYRSLVGQLAERAVGRLYRSLVAGSVEAEGGLIDAPLGRSPSDPTRRAVVAGGKAARTRYEVIRRFAEPVCTEVECRLETGRTHQIRAHMAAIGHPVTGDSRYGGTGIGLELDRPFLHAARLEFDHPITGNRLAFEAELPRDLENVLARLEHGGAGGASS